MENKTELARSVSMRKYLMNKEYYDRKLLEHHSGTEYSKMLEQYGIDELEYNIKVVEITESDDLIASIQNYSRDEYSTAMNGGIWTDYSEPKTVRFSISAEMGYELRQEDMVEYLR